MGVVIRKRGVALLMCCLMGISTFIGFGSVFPTEVNAGVAGDEQRASEYLLLYRAGEGNGDDVLEAVFIDNALAIEYPDNWTVPAGKYFIGWLSSSESISYAPGEKITIPDNIADLQLTAQYKNINAQVTYFNADGSAVTEQPEAGAGTNYQVKTLESLGFTVPAGKAFDGWELVNTGTVCQAGDNINIVGDETYSLKAKFKDVIPPGGQGTPGEGSTGSGSTSTQKPTTTTPTAAISNASAQRDTAIIKVMRTITETVIVPADGNGTNAALGTGEGLETGKGQKAKDNEGTAYNSAQRPDYGQAEDSWSLVSMLLVLLSAVLGVGMILRRGNEDKYRRVISMVLAIVIPIIGVILFFVYNNVATPMVMLKPTTCIFAVISILQLVNMLVGKREVDDYKEEELEDSNY